MDDSLQLLIVDDSEDDALLIVSALRREGYIPNFERVDSRDALAAALCVQEWDVILSEHKMPNFDSGDVLTEIQESGLDVSMIIVSGHIKEEEAVAAMKAGARDYVMKDNLGRLIPAIERELDKIRVHRARKRAEKTIQHMSHNDALTGLMNRKQFEHCLQQALDSITGPNDTHALLYLDLDQFKIINDTCGHVAGDTLLRQLTAVLKNEVRESDTLARLGGDEFAVLLTKCKPDDAFHIAQNLLNVVHDFRFYWQDQRYRISVSIGLVGMNLSTNSIDEVLSAVDEACNLAKEQGRNRIRIYAKDDNEMSKRHTEMQWVSKISQAMEEDRLLLYKQAIIPADKASKNPQGWEFLLRLRDTDGSILSPDIFIPSAERYDLMPDIDSWVISKAFSYIADKLRLHQIEPDDSMFFINISGASLSEASFFNFIIDSLEQYAIPAKMICFEVTETAAITRLDDAVQFINKIKEIGCRFALDDFGSGLSSFSYLKTIPVDFVKIDGSFIQFLDDDPLNYEIVKAINNIGHIAGMQTIAETVEREDAMDKLRDIGVDYMQGYYLDVPSPIDEVEDVSCSA